MKNTLKITLITLAFLTLTACSKECSKESKGNSNNSRAEVTPSTISGTWKITFASTFISTNEDGSNAKEVNLLKEGDNVCEYNSLIVITETTFTIKTAGKNCTPDNKDIVYEWKENTTEKQLNPKAKDIDLLQNGKVIKTLQSFSFSYSGKEINYNIPIKNSALQFTLAKM